MIGILSGVHPTFLTVGAGATGLVVDKCGAPKLQLTAHHRQFAAQAVIQVRRPAGYGQTTSIGGKASPLANR